MSIIVGSIFAVLVFLALLNWSALQRLFGVAKAQVGKAATKAERADPVAMLRESIESEKRILAQAHENRVKQESIVMSVQRLLNQADKEVAENEKRLSVVAKTDDADRQVKIANALIKANASKSKLTKDLADQQEIYNNFRQQVEISEDKVKEKELEANRLEQQLGISKATASMAEISGTMQAAGSNFDDINKHTEEIQRQIDLNNARGKVARERSADVLAEEAENRAVQNQEALALLEKYKTESKAKAGMDELFPAVSEKA